MSNLNKAFIAAYRKDAARAKTPAPHRVARSVDPASVASESRESAVFASLAAPTISTNSFSAQALPTAAPAVSLTTSGPAHIVSATSPQQAPVHAAFPTVPDVPEVADVPTPVAGPVAPMLAFAEPERARQRRIIDSPHAVVPAPHVDFVEPRIVALAEARPAPSEAPQTQADAPAASDPQAINPRLVILPMTGPSPVWRPVFEVTNFTWPELTGLLLDTAAAQFRAAATELAEGSRRHRKLIAVTAAHRGEGCTVVALALAKALAEQEQRIILVDAHFDAPRLADSLGIAPQVGWEEILTGERLLTEALVESLEDGLTVLPMRQPAGDDWRLSVSRLKASFDELRRHCDLVLVDAGPLGEGNDRRHLLSWAAPCRVDRALVVRDLRATDDVAISDIEDRLHGCGIAQWNFVENFAA